MSEFSLIIFDCDGVLVDSETLSARVWCELLAEHGVVQDPAAFCRRFAGKTDRDCAAILRAEAGIPLPEDTPREIERRATALFDTELAVIPGVAAVIHGLAVPACVCSNSGPFRLERTLRTVGLYDRFGAERIFSAAQVARAKPAPDLHLHAAFVLGAEPARCLVIEDSVTGVAAARAAGMTAWGFTGAYHGDPAEAAALLDEAGAARTFHAMQDLGAALPG